MAITEPEDRDAAVQGQGELRALELVNGAPLVRETLASWGVDPGRALRAAEVRELERLAAALGRLTDALADGGRLDAPQLAELNALIGRVPSRTRLVEEPGGSHYVLLEPVGGTWADRAVTTLAGSFAALLRRAHPTRIRRCEDLECRTAFWDESRNRSRRWCGSGACGNRARVRRHRERARAAR